MTTRFATLILCLFTFGSSFSQTDFMDHGGSTALEKGHFQFDLGSGYTNFGVPIYGGVEYAFNEDITLGGFASYSSYKESWFNANWKHEVLGAFGVVNMHINRLLQFDDHVDLYGGFIIGFNSISTTATDNTLPFVTYSGNRESGLIVSFQAGARYFFAENFGVHGRVIVGGITGVHAGLTYRLQ